MIVFCSSLEENSYISQWGEAASPRIYNLCHITILKSPRFVLKLSSFTESCSSPFAATSKYPRVSSTLSCTSPGPSGLLSREWLSVHCTRNLSNFFKYCVGSSYKVKLSRNNIALFSRWRHVKIMPHASLPPYVLSPPTLSNVWPFMLTYLLLGRFHCLRRCFPYIMMGRWQQWCLIHLIWTQGITVLEE